MASHEYQATSSRASSSNTNLVFESNAINSILRSLTFNTPINLTNNNYLLWRSQVIAIINANELEDLIDNTKTPPNRNVIRVDEDKNVINLPNLYFQVWR